MSNNYLPATTIEQLRRLRADGASQRAIARQLGISANTVARYVGGDEAKCACGAPAGHKGWCKNLYAKSVARQAFHAARKGQRIEVAPPVPKSSRLSKVREEKHKWLGRILGDYRPLQASEHMHAVSIVQLATREVHDEWREDVRQEMILACIEGRLRCEDARRAVYTFWDFVSHGERWRWRELEMPLETWHIENIAADLCEAA